MEAEQRLRGECSTAGLTIQPIHSQRSQSPVQWTQSPNNTSNHNRIRRLPWMLLMMACLLWLISDVEAVRERRPKSGCSKLRNPIVAELLEKVCLMCHEMYSHDKPNLHAHCRKNCFRNTVFEECAKQFGSQQPLSGLPLQTLSLSGTSL